MGKRLRIAAVISAVALATALGTLVPTVAKAANPATGTVTTDFGGHLQKHVVSAPLATQINSGNWGNLTEAQLASAGIHPGMGSPAVVAEATAPAATTAMTGTAAPAAVSPNTGSGCNFDIVAGSMCIYVYGTGLVVNEWDTSVANPFGLEKCTYAGYWINGRLAITSNEVCGNGIFWAFDVGRVTYPNQTQLCNSWVNFTGHPCLVVHT